MKIHDSSMNPDHHVMVPTELEGVTVSREFVKMVYELKKEFEFLNQYLLMTDLEFLKFWTQYFRKP